MLINYQGRRSQGEHMGHVPLTHNQRGGNITCTLGWTSHALVSPPLIGMKLIDCFGLLCNL